MGSRQSAEFYPPRFIDEEILRRILIVDDDPLTLEALEKTLQRENLDIHKSESGEQAIEMLHNTSFSVIICDYHMPKFNGVEVLKQALKIQPDAIRIAITGGGDLNVAAEMINTGQVSQFIIKPWDYDGLVQMIHASIEQFKLIGENRHLQELTLEQNKQLTKNHALMERDINMGGRVQKVLLEGNIPHDIEGLSIKGITIPSKVIDGDFFGFYRQSPHILDIVVGDVMGKGLPAALVGTAVKSELNRYASSNPLDVAYDKEKGWHHNYLTPAQILTLVHSQVSPQLIKLEYFVSLFYCRIDQQNQTLTYVDCGSTKPLHYCSETKKTSELRGENFPIGIIEEEEHLEKTVSFLRDDLLVFYSDGLTEAMSPAGELFGVERLKKLVSESADKVPDEIIKRIKKEVSAFTETESFNDDLTLFVFRIDQKPVFKPLKNQNHAKFSSDLSQLKAVRHFVKNFCNQIPEKTEGLAENLLLSLNEIFCNIVRHGYHNKPGGEIIIRGIYEDRAITFTILDKGDTFDPTEISDPSFAGDKFGGFGLYMIKQIADKISYTAKTTHNGWNKLTIVKKLLNEERFMEISHRKEGNILIISLEGENLDAKASPDFKQKVIDLVNSSTTHHVILDLKNLDFIDSTGLGAFLSLLRTLNSQQGDLKLVNMSRPIRTIFELVCMHKIFEIYNSVDEAVRSYSPAAKTSKS